ncbi:hypothetical protein [Cognatiyoonia sp. IB215182]|uniref:hypothetical protein n=1 Tax=Cognatiyoonia sp. IB215182 TaxID=3097353 RepID=UPI002A16430D|nr:hypothetical protein [Cognatiyoonia sp. IB215182]MDX8352598.1 hypothetical protein [Cognatiyoonia sp. IB215182]
MGRTKILGSALLVAALGAVAATDAQSQETCVAVVPEASGAAVGYELIDIIRREAWVTRDWTLADYAAFSPGPAALNWRKNDPREGDAANARVMRSPECGHDGDFTYQIKFGREFFHIANIVSIGPRHGPNGEIREGGVVKYHRLTFDAGQTVSILHAPEGTAFIRVNRPVAAPHVQVRLPEGWSVTTAMLNTPWRVDLFGGVRVLRLQDGSSYQGPIEMPEASLAAP